MKRTLVIAAVILGAVALLHTIPNDSSLNVPKGPVATVSSDQADRSQVIKQMNLTPLTFTENQGQWNESVLFRANAGRALMWFTNDGVYHQFTRRESSDDALGAPPLAVGSGRQTSSKTLSPEGPSAPVEYSYEQLVITSSLVGANTHPKVIGSDTMEFRCNYFLGNDPDKWRTNVPNYRAIVLEEVYAGVDLKYYSNESGKLEYDFIVEPGADPSVIQVHYDGANSLSVNDAGELVIETNWHSFTQLAPKVYQMQDGDQIDIGGDYVLMPNNTFAFELGDGYDPSLALVIDPVLVFSTYLGGGNDDVGQDIAVNGSGNPYVAGYTYSTNFPTMDPYQMDQGNSDVFVTKLSSTGNSLEYSTYLGGNSGDFCYSIAIDDLGAMYITGFTQSSDFPTLNPFQTDQGNNDVFVTKLSSSGSSLEYSTYLGGADADYGNSLFVDGLGAVYVTGYTQSVDFPTLNPYQTDQGGTDAFITKLSSLGNTLVYCTYLGGNSSDWGQDIYVNASGEAYVTGYTQSVDFPLLNPYQTDQGGMDVFVTKLTSSGNNLHNSTYIGGSGTDRGIGIEVDGSGSAYVMGHTQSTDFPTLNPYMTDQDTTDVFITKLSGPGNSLIYSTYIGGEGVDYGSDIAVDNSGIAYLTGSTYSADFPTANPYQGTPQGFNDGFVTMLAATGGSLMYSTYLGGDGEDWGTAIAVDEFRAAYVSGHTMSTDFPTLNQFQTNQSDQDAFVAKFAIAAYVCGDADGSGEVDIDDVVYLIAYIFSGGPEPVPYESGDADCSGGVDIDDVVWLIAYIFSGGNAPCDTNGDTSPDC